MVPEFKVSESCENVLILESELSTENKYKQVKKIHTQFGHASKDNVYNSTKCKFVK